MSVVFCDLSDAGDLENKEQKNGLAKKKVESAGRVARYIDDGLPHHGLNIGVDSD